ncbi:hypothetical protein [Candidatus Similichlamydia laticola]|uniref:hypothetical protein n=1 Tax=Candidatus Similichlamydia laticola TaxID=2170265 RepID=UPI0011C0176E|nr:hypothetical protein [Candidatus Similichlamydia laticola]
MLLAKRQTILSRHFASNPLIGWKSLFPLFYAGLLAAFGILCIIFNLWAVSVISCGAALLFSFIDLNLTVLHIELNKIWQYRVSKGSNANLLGSLLRECFSLSPEDLNISLASFCCIISVELIFFLLVYVFLVRALLFQEIFFCLLCLCSWLFQFLIKDKMYASRKEIWKFLNFLLVLNRDVQSANPSDAVCSKFFRVCREEMELMQVSYELHSAALATVKGELVSLREDISRLNLEQTLSKIVYSKNLESNFMPICIARANLDLWKRLDNFLSFLEKEIHSLEQLRNSSKDIYGDRLAAMQLFSEYKLRVVITRFLAILILEESRSGFDLMRVFLNEISRDGD